MQGKKITKERRGKRKTKSRRQGTKARYVSYITTIRTYIIFRNTKLFSSGRGSFLALSVAGGTQGARLYTTARVWVPAGLHGACSERSKSRNSCQVATGSLSAGLEPSKTMENPHFSFFALVFAPLLYSHGATLASSFPRCHSHGHYSCACARVCAGLCMYVLALGRASFGMVFVS